MDADRYVTFAAQVRAQLLEIAAIHDRIDERERVAGPAGLESLALQLHNLYSATEGLFEIVADACENHVDAGAGYRTSLLRRMHVAVPGVRPAAVSDEALPLSTPFAAFAMSSGTPTAPRSTRDSFASSWRTPDPSALCLWRDVEASSCRT